MSHVQINREFPSRAEGHTRTVRVYTPDEYEQDPNRRFPVLYMMDGQNVFAHHQSAVYDTWCANLVLERLVDEGALEPWIIVAIDSGPGRMEDYTPFPDKGAKTKGRAETYGRFLVNELKPWVDRMYRTRSAPEWTAVMGSSLGGLVSLYLGHSLPHVFGRIGALSPTVMWGDKELFRRWTSHSRRWSRIYLDAGLHEFIQIGSQPLDYGNYTREFYFHLKELGYGDHELFLVLEPGGNHHEKDWHRRLPLAFRWLLG